MAVAAVRAHEGACPDDQVGAWYHGRGSRVWQVAIRRWAVRSALPQLLMAALVRRRGNAVQVCQRHAAGSSCC